MPAAVETPVAQETARPWATTMAKEKAAELVKQATAFAARATETLEHRMSDVRGTVSRTRRSYEELKTGALNEVRAHPARTIGLTLLAGVTLGWAVGAARAARARRTAWIVCEDERVVGTDLD